MNHTMAIQSFIEDKAKTFTNEHPSNWGHFLDRIKCVEGFSNPTIGKSIAFYFKGKEATHGSIYTDKFGHHDIENHSWTSKLGQYITISHQDLKDLVGDIYGYDYDNYCIIN